MSCASSFRDRAPRHPEPRALSLRRTRPETLRRGAGGRGEPGFPPGIRKPVSPRSDALTKKRPRSESLKMVICIPVNSMIQSVYDAGKDTIIGDRTPSTTLPA